MTSGAPLHITILSQRSPRAVVLKTMIRDFMGDETVVNVLGINEAIKSGYDIQTDICIVDLMSSNYTARITLASIREIMPNAGIIAMHIYSTPELIQPLFDHGVNGYLTDDPSRQELIRSIKDVAAGKQYLPIFH